MNLGLHYKKLHNKKIFLLQFIVYLIFCMIFLNTISYAQIPDVEIPKFPTKEVKKKQNEEDVEKWLVGVNLSKAGFRPISGGFSVDTEVHRFFGKLWAYGAEIGYTEYFWKAKNFDVHNKGFYFKPMLSIISSGRLSLDERIYDKPSTRFMFSVAFPLGTFDERTQLSLSNNYYTNNPTQITDYKGNNFFYGLELIASMKIKINIEESFRLYFVFGGRLAPYLYTQHKADAVQMNTRYFPGSGYNLNYGDTNQKMDNQNSAIAVFVKLTGTF